MNEKKRQLFSGKRRMLSIIPQVLNDVWVLSLICNSLSDEMRERHAGGKKKKNFL